MREERAFAFVQSRKCGHVALGELEVEYVEIFLHSFAADGLWYNDNPALYQISQSCLGDSFAVLFADGHYSGVGKKVLPALGERPPALMRDPVLFHHGVGCLLLLENVCFDLVDRGLYLAEVVYVDQPVGVEV